MARSGDAEAGGGGEEIEISAVDDQIHSFFAECFNARDKQRRGTGLLVRAMDQIERAFGVAPRVFGNDGGVNAKRVKAVEHLLALSPSV